VSRWSVLAQITHYSMSTFDFNKLYISGLTHIFHKPLCGLPISLMAEADQRLCELFRRWL